MASFFKNKFQVWWMQVMYMIVNAGFMSILYAYFVKGHLNFWYIILAEAIGTSTSVIFILLKRQFSLRLDMQFGFVLVLLGMLSLLLPLSPLYLLIPYTLLKVTGGIMFFIPYNILFFEKTDANKKLYRMTTYWAIATFVGILAPICGGFFFARFGIILFIYIAITLLAVGIALGWLVKEKIHDYTLLALWTHLKGFRTITMIDGALPTASQLLLTLYLLTFIHNEFNFGVLSSCIALVSLTFSFPFAKFSDKYKKRLELLWPLSCLAGGVMVLFSLTHTLMCTIILIVLFKFITTLLWPIQSNIVCDRKNITATTWIARDLFLNIGRSFVLFCLVPVVYFGFLKVAFIAIGVLFVVLPMVVFRKGVYKC